MIDSFNPPDLVVEITAIAKIPRDRFKRPADESAARTD